MDFTLDEEQQAISELAARIVGDKVDDARLRELTTAGEDLDGKLWAALADAGLLAICLPESHGGTGFTVLEAALVLEELGRRVAPVPYLWGIVGGARAISTFGDDAQRDRWLPALGSGDALVVPALAEGGRGAVPQQPATTARSVGGGWVLEGEKLFVPWAAHADRLLVPARTLHAEPGEPSDPDGRSDPREPAAAVFLVDPHAAGVSLERLETTSGLPEHAVVLDGATVATADRLGGEACGAAAVVGWLEAQLAVGLCALQAGVSAEALRLTAVYTSQRHQFNAPIATFQAVAQRAADAYIDVQGIRFTMLQAAWRLATGRPAADEIDIATFWAAEGGQRVAHAAQHLHGGIGVDTDYPLHRYFLWAKHLELTLGGATEHLRRLGARLAEAS